MNAPPRRLLLNAIEMSTAGHLAFGLWRRPTPTARDYTDLRYWTELGAVVEQAGFDSLFLTDALGQLDIYGRSADRALIDAVQTPLDDPLLAVSALATSTEHLGIAVTVSATYEHPYLLARKFTTLDHLTDGRIGWNIVTSQLDSAARNLGLERQLPHDQRYDRADEFLEVTYKLWEGSWEDDAVRKDTVAGVYADPARVHAIGHHGQYFDVPSAHLSEPSPQRTPVLFQAGSSPRGREFAARHAEVVFVAGSEPPVIAAYIADIRQRAAALGRDPGTLRFIGLATVVTAESDAAAHRKLDDYRAYRSVEGAIAHFSAITGIDWGAYDLDAPLQYIETDSNRSILASLTKDSPGITWTLRQIFDNRTGVGGYGPSLVGSGETVATALLAAAAAADLDGFNIAVPVALEEYAAFGEFAAPVLRERGVLGDPEVLGDPATLGGPAGPGHTLRQRIFGSSRLSPDHPGARYRTAFLDQPSAAPSLLAAGKGPS